MLHTYVCQLEEQMALAEAALEGRSSQDASG